MQQKLKSASDDTIFKNTISPSVIYSSPILRTQANKYRRVITEKPGNIIDWFKEIYSINILSKLLII